MIFEDLSLYAFDCAVARISPALNVGWLGANHDFPKKRPSAQFLDALWQYCLIQVLPTRGLHDCDLCAAPPSTFVRHGTRLLLGQAEIRVLGANGSTFAAPNLIYHYVSDHQYRPPADFVEAVESGPHPSSEEYRSWLGRRGISWWENVHRGEEPGRFRFVRTEKGVER